MHELFEEKTNSKFLIFVDENLFIQIKNQFSFKKFLDFFGQ